MTQQWDNGVEGERGYHCLIAKVSIRHIFCGNFHTNGQATMDLEAVALTQECIHSMHSRKIEAALLKIDLKKAYDYVNWGFIRCLLARIGLDVRGIRWTMVYVVEVNYAVLINGVPTPFFKAARGFCQGCSLSPLLSFLLWNL